MVCKQGLEGGATCCLSPTAIPTVGPLECDPPEPAHMDYDSYALITRWCWIYLKQARVLVRSPDRSVLDTSRSVSRVPVRLGLVDKSGLAFPSER